jgi:hypothetical protein
MGDAHLRLELEADPIAAHLLALGREPPAPACALVSADLARTGTRAGRAAGGRVKARGLARAGAAARGWM